MNHSLVTSPTNTSHRHNAQSRIWAVIPAAGTGSRFSSHVAKQYQMLDGQTVLQQSINSLKGLAIESMMLAVSPRDELIKTLALPAYVKWCLGGETRADSVQNALHALEAIGADAHDYVLVHDAARPCLHQQQIELIKTFIDTHQAAAIIATPVRDSLKKSQHNPFIEHSVNREGLWQAQTPQIAQFGILKAALERAKRDNHAITDEAGALEYSQIPVQILSGRFDNIKITYPEDLALAAAILQSHRIDQD